MIYHPIGHDSYLGVAHMGEEDTRQNYRIALTTDHGYHFVSDDMWSPKGDPIDEGSAWHVTVTLLHAVASGEGATDDHTLLAWCKDHALDLELALLLVHEGS